MTRFGDLSKADQDAAIRKACAALQTELEAAAPAISAWLNDNDAPEMSGMDLYREHTGHGEAGR